MRLLRASFTFTRAAAPQGPALQAARPPPTVAAAARAAAATAPAAAAAAASMASSSKKSRRRKPSAAQAAKDAEEADLLAQLECALVTMASKISHIESKLEGSST